MADEKTRCGDGTSTSNTQLQTEEDDWFLSMQDELCKLPKISVDYTEAITVNEPKTMQQPFPLSCEDNFSLITAPQNPKIVCDNILRTCDSTQSGPVSDSRVEVNADKFHQGVTIEDMVVAESLANKSSTHVLCHSRDTGEMRNNCNDMTNVVQFSSAKFDGSITSLGAEVSKEDKSKFKGFHETKAFLPQLTTFHGQKDDGGSSNPGSKTAESVSRFQNNVGGVSSPGHNVARFHHFLQNKGANTSMVQNATESSGPSQSVHGWTFSKNDRLFPAAGKQIPAYQKTPAQTGKSQITGHIQPPDRVISVASESGFAQVSNASVGPRQKRCATQPLSIAHPIQRRTITHPSLRASARASPSLTHLSQKAPVLPQAQTAASLPSLLQTVHFPRRLSQTQVLPSTVETALPFSHLAKKIPPHHIAKDSNRTSQPSGWKCMLCKRDLLFTPEGPVSQPSIPPVAAVLPCGHCFHDHCLQCITPADQSKDPPCIPCALGEN